jgi:hypothetical protein
MHFVCIEKMKVCFTQIERYIFPYTLNPIKECCGGQFGFVEERLYYLPSSSNCAACIRCRSRFELPLIDDFLFLRNMVLAIRDGVKLLRYPYDGIQYNLVVLYGIASCIFCWSVFIAEDVVPVFLFACQPKHNDRDSVAFIIRAALFQTKHRVDQLLLQR